MVCLAVLLLANDNGAPVSRQSCRRFQAMLVGLPTCGPLTARNGLKRLSGYLDQSTFIFLLSRICNAIQKDTITEESISPEARLAISLYRLAISDHCFTTAETAEIEEQTVGYVDEVTTAIVDCLWEDTVKRTVTCRLEIRRRIWKQNRRCGESVAIPLLLVSSQRVL